MLKRVSENPLYGELKKDDIKIMVNHWRHISVRKKLKYAHFKLSDVLQLLVDNDVLPKAVTEAIKAAKNDEKLKTHGLKIYLGRHKELKTCPPENVMEQKEYLNKATTILCTTIIELNEAKTQAKGFRDMLKDDKVLIGSRSGEGEGGNGLDQAEIEPPFHTQECEIYDVGEDDNCA